MLAANDPGNPIALLPLAQLSQSLYPDFLRRVESLSGLAVPLRTRQTLQALPKEPSSGLEPCLESCPVLGTDELLGLEPSFHPHEGPDATPSWILLEEASIDPRDLCAALPVAAQRVGVEMREHTAWLPTVSPATHRKETGMADFFVDCRGAWAHSTALDPANPPASAGHATIRPVKGQALLVALPSGVELRRTIRSGDVYLVSRGDGPVLIGATVEEAGYDTSTDDASLHRLLLQADQLVPGLLDATVLERWAGLRPATPDGLPLLGPLPYAIPDQPSGFIAAGHFRNGILLAPATAVVMSQLLCGEPVSLDLAPFSPARFAA